MFTFLGRYSHLSLVGMLGLFLLVVPACAADGMHEIVVHDVHTVADITSQLPVQGLYNLQIRFAGAVAPVERTEILSAAFEHERARSIKKLDLDDNQLELSPVLRNLTALKCLLMRKNSLTQPPVLTGLGALELLLLDSNRLSEPPLLDGLSSLTYIDLSYNRLVSSPLLNGLVNLQCLLLSYNQLHQPPVLNDLINLSHLDLMNNPLATPAIIPLALLGVIDEKYIRAPYRFDRQALVGAPTRLVDIATPCVDTVPFFLSKGTVVRLTAPKCNPLTSRRIVQAMSLVVSWRYWRDRGVAADAFDEKLQEIEPVLHEENVYTVDRRDARAFMQERGVSDVRIGAILDRLRDDEVNLGALLGAMRDPHIPDSLLERVVDEFVPISGSFFMPCSVS